MRILEETTHLIIITIKSYTYADSEKSIIIILDLFNFNVVLIKMLDTTDNLKINQIIINFYKLYNKNYEFLTDLKKDLNQTSILFLNFNQSILIPFNKPQDWWNEKQELRGLESMTLIDNQKLITADYNNLDIILKKDNQMENENIGIKNCFTWGEIPQYVRYNVFLTLHDIINNLHKNKIIEIDFTKFV